jgi:hypothetical protein
MRAGVCEEDLIGAWTLLSWTIEYPRHQRVSFPFGENATGLLLYAPGGFMSAGISRSERCGFQGGNVRHATPSARAAAFDSHFHYQGRFHVSGRFIEHEVTQSLNPDFVGTVQRREALLEGETLELRAEDQGPDGSPRTHRLIWRRAD